jgi:hypothetical protein
MQLRNERGGVLTMVLIGIIILLSTAIVTAVIVAFLDKDSSISPTYETKPTQATPLDDDNYTRLNDMRKAEAALLTDAVYRYYMANKNQYPTGFSDGKLTGGEVAQPVKLTYFKQPLVATGAQAPLDADTVRVVTKAHCAPSGAGTLAGAGTGYDYAVQYTAQNLDGTLAPKCNQP